MNVIKWSQHVHKPTLDSRFETCKNGGALTLMTTNPGESRTGTLSARAPWKDLLARPAEGFHIVQVYDDSEFLEEAVSLFIRTGLKIGEGVLVVATPAHREAFLRRSRAVGVD